jgi:hypothetical protein
MGVVHRLSRRFVASWRRCLFPFPFQRASFPDEPLALELGPRRLSLALHQAFPLSRHLCHFVGERTRPEPPAHDRDS